MAEAEVHAERDVHPRPAQQPAIPRPPLARMPTRPHDGLLTSVQSTLYVLIVGLFVITFTAQPIRIPSGSMEPTLLIGDFLLLDKQAVATNDPPFMPPAGIQRGDIIVFHDPVDDPAVHLVKRVVGVPGDHLHLHDGVVYLNGRPLPESYTVHRPAGPDAFRDDFPSLYQMDSHVDPAWWAKLRGLVHDGELTVPPGNFFVLGDNRNESEDSRYWGFVPMRDIVGSPRVIYFSWRSGREDELGGEGSPQTAGGDARKADSAGSGLAGRLDFARWDRVFRIIR